MSVGSRACRLSCCAFATPARVAAAAPFAHIRVCDPSADLTESARLCPDCAPLEQMSAQQMHEELSVLKGVAARHVHDMRVRLVTCTKLQPSLAYRAFRSAVSPASLPAAEARSYAVPHVARPDLRPDPRVQGGKEGAALAAAAPLTAFIVVHLNSSRAGPRIACAQRESVSARVFAAICLDDVQAERWAAARQSWAQRKAAIAARRVAAASQLQDDTRRRYGAPAAPSRPPPAPGVPSCRRTPTAICTGLVADESRCVETQRAPSLTPLATCRPARPH